MIYYKSERELKIMREAGRIIADAFELIKKNVRPGLSTLELDKTATEYILSRQAKPAFKGYRGYPGNICVSVNEEVVHGIPGKRILREGDIVSIDIGVSWQNYFADAAITLPVGRISEPAKKLIAVTELALNRAIEQMQPDVRLSSVSALIQNTAESNGFSVVRDFVGHGIGSAIHEDPQVPNYVMPPKDNVEVILKPGLVLALEPMLNEGAWQVEVLPNKWTVVTKDRKLSAHFEHTVAVTENGREVLTA